MDFRDAYSLLCGNSDMPIINDSCQLDTNITDCISSLEDSTSATSGGDNSGGDSLACSSECGSELDDYYERCTDNSTYQAFRNIQLTMCSGVR